MRLGNNEKINLDGKLHEIISYNTNEMSAYKLAGFFKELFEKASSKGKDFIVRADNGDIINVKSHGVYFMPENGWENSAKQRDDYYGKMRLCVFDENDKEYEVAAFDDCYEEENVHTVKINLVKIIVSDAVVVEIKTAK
ncbi:MAG: hypothetical protein ACRCTZ_05355 [Sarcina sp.]